MQVYSGVAFLSSLVTEILNYAQIVGKKLVELVIGHSALNSVVQLM